MTVVMRQKERYSGVFPQRDAGTPIGGDDGATHRDRQPNQVFLVGAGPGDPELITVKALRCLRIADVVIYDRLVNPALLDEARPSAERIFVGKHPHYHAMRQEEINALLVAKARLGRRVVRLKGGDPFVFGRGGEEALALVEANIPFEVVPGISSALAVPAYAGIPVTHRDCASSVTIITGHECRKEGRGVQWEKFAALEGTLVILMGIEALASITGRLLGGGLAADTPAAVIQQGTVAEQRVVTGTLEQIAEKARQDGITSPAVTVIGAVVALGETLSWFSTLQSNADMALM